MGRIKRNVKLGKKNVNKNRKFQKRNRNDEEKKSVEKIVKRKTIVGRERENEESNK